jgi:hypothetical protein
MCKRSRRSIMMIIMWAIKTIESDDDHMIISTNLNAQLSPNDRWDQSPRCPRKPRTTMIKLSNRNIRSHQSIEVFNHNNWSRKLIKELDQNNRSWWLIKTIGQNEWLNLFIATKSHQLNNLQVSWRWHCINTRDCNATILIEQGFSDAEHSTINQIGFILNHSCSWHTTTYWIRRCLAIQQFPG